MSCEDHVAEEAIIRDCRLYLSAQGYHGKSSIKRSFSLAGLGGLPYYANVQDFKHAAPRRSLCVSRPTSTDVRVWASPSPMRGVELLGVEVKTSGRGEECAQSRCSSR